MVKTLPAMQEALVPSLHQEDPLKKGMTTHSSILAERIPWTEEPDGLHPWGRTESDTTEQFSMHTREYIVLHVPTYTNLAIMIPFIKHTCDSHKC